MIDQHRVNRVTAGLKSKEGQQAHIILSSGTALTGTVQAKTHTDRSSASTDYFTVTDSSGIEWNISPADVIAQG